MEMKDEMTLKTYQEVLEELENSPGEKHLLLGNGFNLSLGIKTDYESIFEEMQEGYRGYAKLEEFLKENKYDTECLISWLKGQIPPEAESHDFISNYIEMTIKSDFMKAAYSIVEEHIKDIYQEKNQEIHLLLRNFANYFTLNYDPTLYLLLMKFKKKDETQDNHALAFQDTSLSQAESLDQAHEGIYTKIRNARQDGWFTVDTGTTSNKQELKRCNKKLFTAIIKEHFKHEGWKSTVIEKVCNLLWEKEPEEQVLDRVDDGFRNGKFWHARSRDSGFLFDKFKPINQIHQNVFFLHGAFHMYIRKGGKVVGIEKITQTQDTAFNKKLGEIIDADEKDIICVLAGRSQEKEDQIGSNEYLRTAFEKLSQLSGSLVIIGSSLAENDRHIFDQIGKSEIRLIYISSRETDKHGDMVKAREAFPNKQVVLFDRDFISYASD